MRKVLYVAADDVTATTLVDQMYEPLARFLNDDFVIVVADFTEAYEIALTESPDLIVMLGEDSEDSIVAELINLIKADGKLKATPLLNASLEFGSPPLPVMECEPRKLLHPERAKQLVEEPSSSLARAGAPIDTQPAKRFRN